MLIRHFADALPGDVEFELLVGDDDGPGEEEEEEDDDDDDDDDDQDPVRRIMALFRGGIHQNPLTLFAPTITH